MFLDLRSASFRVKRGDYFVSIPYICLRGKLLVPEIISASTFRGKSGNYLFLDHISVSAIRGRGNHLFLDLRSSSSIRVKRGKYLFPYLISASGGN